MIMKNTRLIITGFFLSFVSTVWAKTPNVIIIMTDDQGMVTLVVMGIRFSRPQTSINCIQNPFDLQTFMSVLCTHGRLMTKPSRCYRCLPNKCGKNHAAPIRKKQSPTILRKMVQDRNDRQMASGRQCSTVHRTGGFRMRYGIVAEELDGHPIIGEMIILMIPMKGPSGEP